MAIIKNLSLMSATTILRLSCGTLSFIVMARLLGPDQFGLLMLCFSVSGLLSLIVNFGYGSLLLRELGVNNDQTVTLMSEVLSAKLILSVITIFASFSGLLFSNHATFLVFILLLAAQITDSFTEVFNIGFRATNRFGVETRISSIISVTQLFLVLIGCLIFKNPIAAAFAFLTAKVIALIITIKHENVFFIDIRLGTTKEGWYQIKSNKSFAIDFGLQNLFGQIDSIVLHHFLGPSSVGIYQAGMRLFSGGAQAAGVLANVFLPRASQARKKPEEFEKEVMRIQISFLCVGLLFGSALTLGANLITNILFGSHYEHLATLLPWFGALFLIRFIASSWGIILTSLGEQTYRALINAFQWAAILTLAAFIVPAYGDIGWLISMIIGNSLLVAFYCIKVWRNIKFSWYQILAPSICTALFITILTL